MATIIGQRQKNYVLCNTEKELRNAVESFTELSLENKGYAIDTETGGLDYMRDPLYMISLYTANHPPVVVSLGWSDSKIRLTQLKELFDPLLQQRDLNAYMWNAKFDMHFLGRVGMSFRKNRVIDGAVIAHLINNEVPSKLKHRARTEIGMPMNDFKKLFKLNKNKKLIDYPVARVAAYAADDAIATYRLLTEKYMSTPDVMDKNFSLGGDVELGTLFRRIELPITKILFDMEERGTLMDVDLINKYGASITPALEDIRVKACKLAGTAFNIGSTQQVLALLQKRGHKNLESTGEEALNEALTKKKDPLIELILHFRELDKLRGTYVEGLLKEIDPNQRIHTSFNQGGTDTGRFSSSKPNLQNIPRDGDIRDFFIPPPGEVFIVRDYGQLELRIAAHAADDRVMQQEFRAGLDIHSVGAAGIFMKHYTEVTPEERQMGKSTTSFGVLFGMAPPSLARKLGVSELKAESFIVNWFKKYRDIDVFFKRLVESAKQTGSVRTFLGRVRLLKTLLDPKATRGQLNAAIREVKNTAIQGGAADIVKLGMIECAHSKKLKLLRAKMLLQVHDELMFSVPIENAHLADAEVDRCMTQFPVALKLKVPLTTDGGIGYTWNTAKKGVLNAEFAAKYGKQS